MTNDRPRRERLVIRPEDKRARRSQRLRRAAAAAFFVFSAVLASLRSGALVYALLYLSVLLPLLSAAYSLYVYERLQIVQRIATRIIVKNEPVEYLCRLSNVTASPFTRIKLKPYTELSRIIDFDANRPFTLSPGSVEEFSSPLVCTRRGSYAVGIERIIIDDILGLFSLSFKPPVEYPVTVYPRVLHLDSLGLFNFEGSRVRLFAGSAESVPDDTLREYIPGDELSRIHWKSSAHAGSLMVRERTGMERPSVLIIADLNSYCEKGSDTIAREDNLIETLLAIADYCVAHGIETDICAGDDYYRIRSYVDFGELYDMSCRISFGNGCAPVTVPDSPFTCCALLTTGHNTDAAAQLADAAAAGAECVVMEFRGGVPEQGPASQELDPDPSGRRLSVIRVPDKCRLDTLLSR